MNTLVQIVYSRTSRKRTPPGPRVSVRLLEVSVYVRVRKNVALEGISCTRTSILKLLGLLVAVLSTKGLLDVAFD